MNLLTATPAEFCRLTDACTEGRDWAITQPTMAAVWDECPRPDWLLWILYRLGQRPNNRTLRLLGVWCARHTPLGDGRVVGDLLTDPRLLAALEVAERYAHGRATDAELVAAAAYAADAARAADAAYAAADAAYAAYYAAYYAADAADAAYYADAADAAADAAYAAYYAAYYAAAADAADAAYYADAADAADAARAARAAARAARAAARRAQADQLRRMVPNPFRKEGGAS